MKNHKYLSFNDKIKSFNKVIDYMIQSEYCSYLEDVINNSSNDIKDDISDSEVLELNKNHIYTDVVKCKDLGKLLKRASKLLNEKK